MGMTYKIVTLMIKSTMNAVTMGYENAHITTEGNALDSTSFYSDFEGFKARNSARDASGVDVQGHKLAINVCHS